MVKENNQSDFRTYLDFVREEQELKHEGVIIPDRGIVIDVILCETPVKFILASDGTGATFEMSEYRVGDREPDWFFGEGFLHQYELDERAPSFYYEEDIKKAETYFWEHINPRLDDRYISNDDYSLGQVELYFEKGTKEELKRIALMVLLNEDCQEKDLKVFFNAGIKDDKVKSKLNERMAEQEGISHYGIALLKELSKAFSFYGHYYEYESNTAYKMSGYQRIEEIFIFQTHQTTAHQRMMAKSQIKQAFAEIGIDIETVK